MKLKTLFSIILLLLSIDISYSKIEYSNDSKTIIEKTDIIMSNLAPLADYIADDENDEVIGGQQLYEFREQALKGFNQLIALENKVDKEIALRKGQLKTYAPLIKHGQEFTNKVVRDRYDFIKSKLYKLEEAKAYIVDSKQIIDIGLSEVTQMRIQSRNKGILRRDNFLGYTSAWQKGINEIKQNIEKHNKFIPFFLSAIFAVIVYNICVYLFAINMRFVEGRLNTYKDRKLINKINIFLRIFWCTFVASLITIGILKFVIVEFGWVERNHIIFIYLVIQNIIFILLKILGVNMRRVTVFWLQLYVFILLCLLSIHGVDYFSVSAAYNPVYGAQGNTVISFIFSLLLVFVAIKVVQKMRSSYSITKGLSVYKNAVRFIIFILAVAYLSLSFIGSDNLIAGVIISILRIMFVFVVFYSLYSVLTIMIYMFLAKLQETSNYSELVIKKVRDSKNESIFEYWTRTIIKMIFIIVGIILVLLEIGIPYHQIADNVYKAYYYGFNIAGEKHFAILNILESILILVVCLVISRVIQSISNKHILPYINIDDGTHKAINTAIGYLGIFISLVIFIYSFGISGTSLAFIVSGLSVGFGFALQDLIKNFFAGLMLLVERPVKIGDWINVDSELGEVKKISLRSTHVETFDRKTLIIPNSLFMSDVISNETFNPISRIVLKVKVAYNSAPRAVSQVLYDVAKNHDRVLKDIEPFVVFEDYGDYSLNFTLRAFCYKVQQLAIESDLRARVFEKLKENNIEVPIEVSKVVLENNEVKN
ncbi:mechanosensitive ion channel [Francisella sp. Scap27]|uniref:mechanosensitive ion channel family protein n=1 Tax=Francisella sp. Scap27 TaxID=2589986 RepID=UPI0015BBE035|nr:mechanosensitive ion channel domain-containing protein [Francisella sp. Scap27]QLE79505.1 mechanosensitive ion channel [Francisella sp. Scap27]